MLLVGAGSAWEAVELRVRAARAEGVYPLELRVADGPEASGVAQLELTALAATLDPHDYGRTLGAALFADPAIATPYREAIAIARRGGQSLHVRLWLDPAAPELHALAWERLYQPSGDGWQPLATAADTPPARLVPSTRWGQAAPRIDRPLRALLLIASPAGLTAFGLDPIALDEGDALQALLTAHGELALTVLRSGTAAPPTLDALREALGQGVDLLHILCHGAVTSEGSVLYLEQAGGGVDPVTTDRLVACLTPLQLPPQLVFLAACDSAVRGADEAFLPLGPALVATGGVPCVVAMRERLHLTTARPLMRHFYDRLLAHGQADLALSEARALITERWDWGAPVLFSRGADCTVLAFPLDPTLARGAELPRAAGATLSAARRAQAGDALVAELERLLGEWEARYRTLADFGVRLRRTGSDPASFAAAFTPLYNDLKDHYDTETWADEEALIRATVTAVGTALPGLRGALGAAEYAQLEQILRQHVATRSGLVNSLREMLERLNSAFESINELLLAGDAAAAVRRKQEVVAQLSAGFSESKELIARLGRDVTQAAA